MDVIGYKIVDSRKIDVDKIDFPKLSDKTLQIIRDAKLDSLAGLLGNDWKNASRELAKKYWGIK
jgi:hypothetical protein